MHWTILAKFARDARTARKLPFKIDRLWPNAGRVVDRMRSLAIQRLKPHIGGPNSAKTNSMNRLSLGMGCLSLG
jgi:hypothetical protein